MSNSTNKSVSYSGKVWCSFFGHKFVTSRIITQHFKEYKCVICNLELTNDENGRKISLTPEHKDINETLVDFYQKKNPVV